MQENKHSPFQLADNPPREASEQIVELYYQCRGFITASNKWIPFGKGTYTDIDVLAVNAKEVHIVSVSTNLDDKNITKLNKFFASAVDYLGKTEEYIWLSEKDIKKVLAVCTLPNKKHAKMIEELKAHGIELLYFTQIFGYFKENLVPWGTKGLKTESPIVKTIHFVESFMR